MSKEQVEAYKKLKEEQKEITTKKENLQKELKLIKEQQDTLMFELISSDSDDIVIVEEESFMTFKPEIFSNMLVSFVLSDDKKLEEFNNYLKMYGEFNFRLKTDGQWDYKKQPIVNKKVLIKDEKE